MNPVPPGQPAFRPMTADEDALEQSDRMSIQALLQAYVETYHRWEPAQAELLVPDWYCRYLERLPAEERAAIVAEVDAIAASFGLRTPTKLIEAGRPSESPPSPPYT